MRGCWHRHLQGTTAQSPRTLARATHAPTAFKLHVTSLGTSSRHDRNSLTCFGSAHLPFGVGTRDPRTHSHAVPEDQGSTLSTGDNGSTTPHPAAAAASSSPSSGPSTVNVLASTEPIDRLRYQAMLVFDQWDSGKSGRLTGQQLEQFFSWCARKESWAPGLAEVLQQVSNSWNHLVRTGLGCSRDEFIRIVRQQVHAVSTSAAYQSSMLRPDVAARLQAQMSVNKQELAAAKWMFGLLDTDNDGKVALSMYKNAQGIEAYVYDDKIEDADADDDGLIVFEEFLGSYAKPKPIGKNLVIMAINTLVIFLILQAPFLDTMIKVVLVGVLFVRPQLVSRPAALLYDSIKALIDQGRAQAELSKQNRGVWRPT